MVSQTHAGMLQDGDKGILLNVAKVIAVLVFIMFCLIGLANYIGSITG